MRTCRRESRLTFFSESFCFSRKDLYLPDVEMTDKAIRILQKRPELKSVITRIVAELKKFYTVPLSLFLEDIYNPEENTTTLSLLVITNDDVDTAYDRMSKFKKNWWWDNMFLADDMLTINSLSIK